jgi:hypothetical protein
MSEQTIVILVVVVGLFSLPFLGGWFAHRLQLSADAAARDADRTRELEDRVQMLERIVTDRGYDVATQIEALRDQRRTAKTVKPQPERAAG